MKKQKIVLPKPLDYQREIIDWMNDLTVKTVSFVNSRQSGKSFLNKLLASKWLLELKDAKIAYITPTNKLGKLFYKELSNALKPFIKSSNGTDLVIEVVSGSYIQFFSAESKDNIRGFQATHLIVDEAAFISDETWDMIIKPMTLVKGKKILLSSTPNGCQGFFYKHIQMGINEMAGFKTKSVNIYSNPFVTKDDIDAIRSQVPKRVFEQEYEAKFLSGSGSVFKDFDNCICENPKLTGTYYAAIDWAKQNDYTVLTIMNDLRQVVHTFRITDMDYTKQVELITAILNKWKPKVTISEENNIGAVINELLKKSYRGTVKVVTLDNRLKRDMIENLVVGFEQGIIGIPNDSVLLGELQAFTCIYNPSTKTVKYTAPNGLHDDCVISLAYVYSLVENKKGVYHIK